MTQFREKEYLARWADHLAMQSQFAIPGAISIPSVPIPSGSSGGILNRRSKTRAVCRKSMRIPWPSGESEYCGWTGHQTKWFIVRKLVKQSNCSSSYRPAYRVKGRAVEVLQPEYCKNKKIALLAMKLVSHVLMRLKHAKLRDRDVMKNDKSAESTIGALALFKMVRFLQACPKFRIS